MNAGLGSPLYLLSLALPAAMLALLLLRAALRRRAVRGYEAHGGGLPLAAGVSPGRRRTKAAILVAAAALAALAAARPQWGSATQPVDRLGADVVFAIDVSASMTARDIAPDRLGRARREAAEIIRRLEGDRVGFVIFARSGVQRFPLTTDLPLAAEIITSRQPLDRLVRPGSSIDAGLHEAVLLLRGSRAEAKAVVLISDGEDLTGGAITAIEEAKALGVTVHAIGIGGSGATIPAQHPATGETVPRVDGSTGQPVITRLVDTALRDVASRAGGSYHEIRTDGDTVAADVAARIAALEDTLLTTAQQERPVERFQVFLALALMLLVLEFALPDGPSRRAGVRSVRRLLPLAPALLLVSCAGGIAALNREGNSLFERGHYQEALSRYREAQVQRPDLLQLHYNIGSTLYRLADYDRAAGELKRLLAASDPELANRAYYALGNTFVRQGRLEDAVQAYRSALKVDPDDHDAKYNLELIQRRLDELDATEAAGDPPGTGGPEPGGSGDDQPGEDVTPGADETPGPDGTPGPDASPTPGEGEAPSGPSSDGQPGERDRPGREPGNPEAPPGDPSAGGSNPDAAADRLRDLLRALQGDDLTPEEALRILDAYRQAQAQRDAAREDAGLSAGGINDW